MKAIYTAIIALIMFVPLFAQHCGSCPTTASTNVSAAASSEQMSRKVLTAKKAQWISDDYYVKYTWQKKPKIGTTLLFMEVYSKTDKIVKDLNITANAYMPSMRGAHDTGDLPMKLNKKGKYVIDVNFMMAGAWELDINFTRTGKPVSNAVIKVNI
jgi:hypothetical protein